MCSSRLIKRFHHFWRKPEVRDLLAKHALTIWSSNWMVLLLLQKTRVNAIYNEAGNWTETSGWRLSLYKNSWGTLFSRGFSVTDGNRKRRVSSTCFIAKTFVFLEKVQLTILTKNGAQPCSRPQLKQLWKRFSSNISHGCFVSVVWPPPPPSKLSDVNAKRTPDVLSPLSPVNNAKVAPTRTFSSKLVIFRVN